MKRLYLYIVCLSALIIIILPSCVKKPKGGPTISVTDPTLSVTTVEQSEQTTEQMSETTTEFSEPDLSVTIETQTTTEGQEVMLVSADPSNPYLNAVVEKYGINPNRLVAFYASSMKTEGNLVFEFDGSTDYTGRPIRSTKTLKNIYTVSSDFVAKKATGTPQEGNEYTEKESKYCEYFVKWVVFRVYSKDIQNA